jgi:AI-2 transport protein TqsA
MRANPVGLPRSVSVFIVLVGIIAVILGMRELAWLITPAFLALVLVVLAYPLYTGLVRRGTPPTIALTALLSAMFGIILGLVAIVLYAVGRLATILPSYGRAATATLSDLSEKLRELGLGSAQIRELFESVDVLSIARFLTAQIPSVASIGAGIILGYSLLLFMGIESAQIAQRSQALAEDHPRLATSLAGFVTNTRRYVAVTGAFAIIVGFLDAVFLLALGVPYAVLWGVLAGACNFIPYLGFIIGLVPPALLALLDQGWQSMLLVIGVYVVLNSVITTILPARFVGNAVGMSMTLTLASVAFWAWVLGPLGAVLAVPLSLLMKAIFIDSVPSARWLAGFVDAAPRTRTRPPQRARGPREQSG